MVCNWLGVAQFLVEDDNMIELFRPGLCARVVSTQRACDNVLRGGFYEYGVGCDLSARVWQQFKIF